MIIWSKWGQLANAGRVRYWSGICREHISSYLFGPGPRPNMIILLLRGIRNQGLISTPGLVSRAAVGDPLELLGVLHSIERVVMVVVSLLMMMRPNIIE